MFHQRIERHSPLVVPWLGKRMVLTTAAGPLSAMME